MISPTLTPTLADLYALYDTEQESILRDYFQYLRFPSISAEPSYKADSLACKDWLVEYIRKELEMRVEEWPTTGFPAIFAELNEAGSDKPTVLVYGHYDVQPVDPLDLWISPPFEPQVRDGQVFARGALDNKGDNFYSLQAIRLLRRAAGKLPVNLKLLIEGEEESGSSGLADALPFHADQIKSDHLLVVDLGVHSLEHPRISAGIRGIVTMTVELEGSPTDLHSGLFGGIAYNPNHALVEILASARDISGRITIPGFYDDVVALSKAEAELLESDLTAEQYFAQHGVYPSGGEKDRTILESGWTRPTLEINGLNGGYSGPGFKTVIPARSMAKVSCRLVPNQDPHKIGNMVSSYIQSRVPEGIKCTVTVHGGEGPAARAKLDSKTTKAALAAYSEVLGAPCSIGLEGGSIPIVAQLAQLSGAEIALLGMGFASDLIHAPNEHFGLDRLRYGYACICRILQILGGANQP